MKRLLISPVVLDFLAAGHGSGSPSARPESGSGRTTVEFKTHAPEPTEAQPKQTNTPVPSPPTPTHRPAPMIAPEPTAIREDAEVPESEEAIVSNTEETQLEPTPVPAPHMIEDIVEIPADSFTTGSYIFDAGVSPYGVKVLAGNAWEWTTDWYQAYPGDTTGDACYSEQCRATRGGGQFDTEPQITTVSRNFTIPGTTANDEPGFRCAMSE